MGAVSRAIEAVWKNESARLVAGIARVTGDIGIAEELAQDAAVQAADTILLTVPSQLGVDYNAAMLDTIAREIAPAIGWSPSGLVPSRG